MPSVTCLRLSDVSVICRVAYFQYPVQVCFSSISVARPHSGVLGLPNIGHRTLPKIWVGFLYVAYKPGELFWIYFNVKIIIISYHNHTHIYIAPLRGGFRGAETRHPVEALFGSEFRAICNHWVVMAVLSRMTLKLCEIFCGFFGKTTHYGKTFKILFESFHRDTDQRCCIQISWNLADGKSCVIYLTKNSPASQTVATARIAPKICQGQPPTMYSSVLQISPKSVHFRRSYSRTRKHRQIAP